MATELFTANRAVTVVSSGGTDAPSSGTTETWTVASSSGFGAASTGVSQFHVADPQQPGEIIAVTNVSGTTWTVTRGAESTTPLAHAAGFTVYQVVTAGFLGGTITSAAQFRTTSDGSNTATYAGQQTFSLLPEAPVANLQPVTVKPDQAFQQVLGVGGAITDSTAYVLMTYLNSGQRAALLTELFGPAAGFSTVRIALGWQNFSSFSTPFTYDDTAGASRTLGCTNGSNTVTDTSAASGDAGKAINLTVTNGTTAFIGNAFVGTVTPGTGYTVVTAPGGSVASNFTGTTGSYSATLYPLDLTLANFTLGSDMTYVVPVLQQIMQINPRVRVFASLWSPPNWMRVTGNALGVGGRSQSNQAQNSDVQTYLLPQLGQYIAQAVMAFEAQGIPIYAVSPQNEPFDPVGTICYYTDTDYATLIASTGAAIDNSGLRTRVFAHDHHWNLIGRITPADPTSSSSPAGTPDSTAFLAQTASRWVSDIGYHAYTEEVDNFGITFHPVSYYHTSLGQQIVRRYNPNMAAHLTEIRCMSTQTWASSVSLIAAACVVGNFQRYGQSLTMWNLALDQNGAPFQGSGVRRGVVTVNNSTGVVTRNAEYWILRHIGQFVKPGAYRIGCTSPIIGGDGQDLQAVAFANPDGSVVCFAVNNSPYARAVQIVDDRADTGFTVQLQPYEFDTFTWTGRQVNPAATSYTPSTPTSIILDTATPGGYAQAASTANAQVLTWSHTVGTGTHPVLVVGVACEPQGVSTPNVSTVTFAGQSLTKLTAAFNTSGPVREADIWYLVNPPAGPGEIVVTLLNTFSPQIGFSSSWFNVNQSAPFRTPATAESNGTAGGLSLSTTGGAASDVVLGCYCVQQTANFTVNGFQAGQIRLAQIAEAGALSLYGCMTQQPGGAGTITTSFINSQGTSVSQAAVAAALVNG
jgi:O-glycosyl hydrolase